MENRNSVFQIIIVVILVAIAILLYKGQMQTRVAATDFATCVAQGNPVMESYPRQCRSGNQTFTENIGNLQEKENLLRLETPLPNSKVSSPLLVKGEARGYWYFEASFPIYLLDSSGKELALGIAQAKSEWMTENFVPFEVLLNFTKPASGSGTLVLKKDNPSGLPEHDDEVRIPVNF